jgi:hypothetical protein
MYRESHDSMGVFPLRESAGVCMRASPASIPGAATDVQSQIQFLRHNFDNHQALIRFADTKAGVSMETHVRAPRFLNNGTWTVTPVQIHGLGAAYRISQVFAESSAPSAV